MEIRFPRNLLSNEIRGSCSIRIPMIPTDMSSSDETYLYSRRRLLAADPVGGVAGRKETSLARGAAERAKSV